MDGFENTDVELDIYRKESELNYDEKGDPVENMIFHAKEHREADGAESHPGWVAPTPLPKCPKCGAKRIGNAKSCRECGERF